MWELFGCLILLGVLHLTASATIHDGVGTAQPTQRPITYLRNNACRIRDRLQICKSGGRSPGFVCQHSRWVPQLCNCSVGAKKCESTHYDLQSNFGIYAPYSLASGTSGSRCMSLRLVSDSSNPVTDHQQESTWRDTSAASPPSSTAARKIIRFPKRIGNKPNAESVNAKIVSSLASLSREKLGRLRKRGINFLLKSKRNWCQRSDHASILLNASAFERRKAMEDEKAREALTLIDPLVRPVSFSRWKTQW